MIVSNNLEIGNRSEIFRYDVDSYVFFCCSCLSNVGVSASPFEVLVALGAFFVSSVQ